VIRRALRAGGAYYLTVFDIEGPPRDAPPFSVVPDDVDALFPDFRRCQFDDLAFEHPRLAGRKHRYFLSRP
jgi:hypothetical protein